MVSLRIQTDSQQSNGQRACAVVVDVLLDNAPQHQCSFQFHPKVATPQRERDVVRFC
jgi:hypothetical protein